MNKWLFHQNGSTRSNLLAIVARVSNFVEENVFLLYIVKAPHPGAFSHAFSNRSNMSIAMHSACSKHWINCLRFTLYHVEGRLKLQKFQHWHFSWLSTIQLSFSKEYSHAPNNVACGLSRISNRPRVAYLVLMCFQVISDPRFSFFKQL